VKNWILAFRPKTLTAALVPVGVGTALPLGLGLGSKPGLAVLALISALFIQIGTNLVNDASDFKKGADTAERIGPKRVTQSGLLSPRTVLAGGLFCFLLAILFGIPLVLSGGWPLVWIGLFSVFAGYAYTAGPFPLAYLGLGDFFVLVFFGWVAVGGMVYLNSGYVEGSAWVAGTQVGLLATVLIAINNLRDRATDVKASKKTLPVRFGERFAKVEIGFLCLSPFLGSVYWMFVGLKWAAVLPILILPLAVRLVRKVAQTPTGPVYNQFLAQGAALHLGFGVLLSLGLVLGHIWG